MTTVHQAIVLPRGLVTDQQNALINSFCSFQRKPVPQDDLAEMEGLPVFPLSGRSLLLAGSCEPSLYHWVFESLCNLQAVNDVSSIDHFLVNPIRCQYQLSLLRQLSIPLDKCVELTQGQRVQAEALVGGHRSWLPSRVNWLRSVLGDQPAYPSRKVFVVDGKNRERLLSFGLRGLLAELGYSECFMEDCCYSEQRKLFASSSHVIAFGEDGLVNLVHSPPGVNVLGFSVDSYYQPLFRCVARTIGGRYSHHPFGMDEQDSLASKFDASGLVEVISAWDRDHA